MIISVSRESKNDEINFAVKVTTKLYGSTIINYNNTFRYGENYVYWNNFKIMFVENDDSTELKIIVQNIDDLS